MMPGGSLVSVVDDDESVREALPDLIKLFGFDVRAFSSATEFLASKSVADTGCLVLDVAMPGMSGPDLQEELVRTGISIPIIFITAHKDENERLALIKSGAVACLFKPFSAAILRETLDQVFKSGGPTDAAF
jgi:FixJ family two-component response regulator